MITVYSKDNCPQCQNAEKLLSMYNIDFQDVNINIDESAKMFLLNQGHKSVPQIYMGNELFVENGLEGLIKLGKNGIMEKLNKVKEHNED